MPGAGHATCRDGVRNCEYHIEDGKGGRCAILTSHPIGKCRFCRVGGELINKSQRPKRPAKKIVVSSGRRYV